MKPSTKEYIIQNLKWPVSHLRYLGNYFILLFPATLFCIGISVFNTNRSDAKMFLLISTIIAFLIIYGVETERKFSELKFDKDLSSSEIAKIILERTKWSFNWQDDNVLAFSTKPILISQRGETATIIKRSKDGLLINSQPNGRSFISLKNRVNYNKVKMALEA